MTLNLKPSLDSTAPKGPTSITIQGTDLEDALQYGPSPGLVGLRGWLSGLQETVHKRPIGDSWGITMGTGSQDLMVKAFGAVLNRGDPILLEAPLYAGVLPSLKNLEAELIEVDVDDQGLSAKNLERVLASWPTDKRRPKAVYSNPTGCNPSGCSASRERKLEVLEVCRKYNLLMIEETDYLSSPLQPSYFELETEVFPHGGHVIRFDSVSKLFSAGMRLGFATGPKALINAIDVAHAANNLHTSSISQAVALALMQHWGIKGFLAHSTAVAHFYAERREKFEALAHKHLDGLATWVSPKAGMFLWIDMSPSGIDDSMELISKEALAKGVLAVPGFVFYPLKRKSAHVRVSFSLVDLDSEAELGFQRLAEAIRDKRRQMGFE
ncbi:tryptophan aminotransferase [Tremella mesenterica]|uniref:Tryptophan aminotransferase n=1 Tax=Tremella mesenterica TaxID=5217 RepID=A0A4Q1BAK4_TREME|nr:tryptophan aminotransferase [Tremella mesenterica]